MTSAASEPMGPVQPVPQLPVPHLNAPVRWLQSLPQ